MLKVRGVIVFPLLIVGGTGSLELFSYFFQLFVVNRIDEL